MLTRLTTTGRQPESSTWLAIDESGGEHLLPSERRSNVGVCISQYAARWFFDNRPDESKETDSSTLGVGDSVFASIIGGALQHWVPASNVQEARETLPKGTLLLDLTSPPIVEPPKTQVLQILN